MCVRRLLFLVLCRRCDCLSWGYWCPCWGHWPRFGYTSGRRVFPIVPWSWLFPGTLWPYIVSWLTLTIWSGCPHLCVRIPVSLFQRKVYLPLVNLLSFVRWFIYFEALPRPLSLVCHVLFLSMSPVRWWFPPRCAPKRWLWPSATVSLWHFWPRFSMCRMSGRPYQIDGGSYCLGKDFCIFCKTCIPFLKDACAFSLPLGVVEYSHDHMPKKNAHAISWPIDVFRCLLVLLYMCRTSFSGKAVWCLVVGSSVL